MVALTRDLLFGLHSIALLDRANGYLPFKDGLFDIVGNITPTASAELVNLKGGSNKYAWDSEEGESASELSMVIRQGNSALYQTGLGAVINRISGTTAGTISTLVNGKGTSAVSATTGIASASIIPSTGVDNIKLGFYVIKVITATTVNIYTTTNVDLLRGTDVEIQDDEMKLLASNITISTGANSDTASLGLRLTGGSGTIGMTIGDTALLKITPPHGGIREYSIGTQGSVNPYVGIIAYSQKKANGEITELFLPKVKLSGMPINFTEKAFAEFEISGTILTDTNPFNTAEEGIAFVRHIKGA